MRQTRENQPSFETPAEKFQAALNNYAINRPGAMDLVFVVDQRTNGYWQVDVFSMSEADSLGTYFSKARALWYQMRRLVRVWARTKTIE